jgi:hypothetical protein
MGMMPPFQRRATFRIDRRRRALKTVAKRRKALSRIVKTLNTPMKRSAATSRLRLLRLPRRLARRHHPGRNG